MALLYGRRIVCEVAGLQITGPRMALEVEREIDETQGKGTIDIYNLSTEHEQQIVDRGEAVTVLAGYPQTLAIVFQGQVQRVVRARENLARITRIHMGDEVRKDDRLGGISLRSYNGVVTVRQVARDLAADMELPLGPLDAIPEAATVMNFYWSGPTANALTHLLERVECQWYEADGTIRINKVNEQQVDGATIMVSPANGLVDSPIVTDEGAEARMFLNPAVTLGCRLELQSEVLSGVYKVVGLRHAGDNWNAQPFITWVDLRSLEASPA